MNQKQKTHLEARIRSVKDYAIRKLPRAPDSYCTDKELMSFGPPENVKVAIAQRETADKVIRAWKKGLNDKRERAVNSIEKEAQNVTEVLLFGDEEKALAAVKAFESKYEPKG